MSLQFYTWRVILLLIAIALCGRTGSSPTERPPNANWIPGTWQLLGSGFQGSVFAVPSKHDPGVTVAVKMRDSPAAASKEAAILGQLNHPAIPRLLSYHPDDDFFTMEYIEGGTLDTIPRPEEARVIAIICELVSILAHLHASRIAHQDLQLQNVMLTPTGQVKLVDFGIAVSFAPKANDDLDAFMQAHHWDAYHLGDVWALQYILLQLCGATDGPCSLTPRLREVYDCLDQYIHLRGVDASTRRAYLRQCCCKG